MNEMIDYLRMRITGKSGSERGASAVEYGLLVSLIAIVIIAAVVLLGNKLSGIFNTTASSLKS